MTSRKKVGGIIISFKIMITQDTLPINMKNILIYEDSDLIIVNKPAGLRTIRDGYNAFLPYLIGELEKNYGQLWVVHRLDKDTSGLVVIARNPQSHRALNQQFENRQVKKIYHALIIGNPTWDKKTVQSPLHVNGDRRHRTTIDPIHGKPACTEFEVLKRWNYVFLVAAIPFTGYTHQIRVHLWSEGFPILADPLYKKRDAENRPLQQPLIHRLALHALKISFQHPATNTPMSIEAPHPPDFQRALQFLEQQKQDRD